MKSALWNRKEEAVKLLRLKSGREKWRVRRGAERLYVKCSYLHLTLQLFATEYSGHSGLQRYDRPSWEQL